MTGVQAVCLTLQLVHDRVLKKPDEQTSGWLVSHMKTAKLVQIDKRGYSLNKSLPVSQQHKSLAVRHDK